MKNLEAILRANDLSMIQIYFQGGDYLRLCVELVEFDALRGESEVSEELTVEADEDDDTIEKLLALLEKQAEITLRENAAEAFWKAQQALREEETGKN
jgi:hypothetical protein